eukprot:gene13370-biopygen5705
MARKQSGSKPQHAQVARTESGDGARSLRHKPTAQAVDTLTARKPSGARRSHAHNAESKRREAALALIARCQRGTKTRNLRLTRTECGSKSQARYWREFEAAKAALALTARVRGGIKPNWHGHRKTKAARGSRNGACSAESKRRKTHSRS